MDHSEKVDRQTNPREKANILSVLTFFYTGKIFARGFKRDLEDDDLYEVIKKCRSQQCTDKLENAYNNEAATTKPGKKVSVLRILWKLYGFKYFALGIIHMTWRLLTSTLEPVAISNLVAYFKPGQTQMTLEDAVYAAALMLGLEAFHNLYYQNYFIYITELAIQIRISMCSLIYRKALRLSPKAFENTSLGNIVTIITKDIQQFEQSIWMFNDVWISIIQTIVICILIYLHTGSACIVGVFMLLALIPVQAWISRIIRNLRLKMAKRTDERLQRMQESLSTIKTIKMYTWEQVFADKIGEARYQELKTLLKATYSKMSLGITSSLVARFSLYSVLMIYIWIHNDMSAEDIYYIMKIFGALRVTVAKDFSIGFTKMGELSASLKRITNILELEELPEVEDIPDNDPYVNLKCVSLKFQEKFVLKDISLELAKGLNIVTGQLGCGKSSLIKVILRDYPEDEGTVNTRGRMSYASQDPWLFPSSIKQNILFGEEYNASKYKQVIFACALEYDFQILEKGDETILTDRGMNLSKGQQARINLARAVYKESDIYLIDDALTALDSRVQEHIFKYCIQELLKDKCVVFVTHNPKHIQLADKVVILKDGEIKFSGDQLNISTELLEGLKTLSVNEPEATIDEEKVNEKTKLIEEKTKAIRRKQVYHEEKKSGNIDFKLYFQYIKMGGYILSTLLVITFGVEIFLDSVSQKLLSSWINQKAYITRQKEVYIKNTTADMDQLLTVANYSATIFLNGTFNVSSTAIKEISYLEVAASSTMSLYTISTVVLAGMELIKRYLILKVGMKASISLHDNMVNKVLKATMTFYDNFFIGNILNRFSQDFGVVDEHLPIIMSSFVGNYFHLIGIVGLIASVNWKFMVPAIVMAITSILIRFVYIRTARSLKRLEAATRSPIVGHLNSTMEGLTTIRAYKAQEILKIEFDKHQDLYTSAFYTSVCTKAAFSFIMNFSALLFVTTVVIRFLFLDNGSFAGDVGLTLTQAGVLTSIINTGLMTWSELENQMTSVERVMEYTLVESERDTGVEVSNWPSKGEIVYERVSLKYTNSHENVLKDISFTVRPGTKIGIVGRTGAGKSSIISTLYRLYNYEGQIYIDGTEIKTLSLSFLRQHISIIPQDPIMFLGTIRSNIDPLEQFTDEDIWQTLHKVQLNNAVPHLEAQVADLNFSTGQRQLICLARAIIKRNKIVVLDEATANMDPETEKTAQKIIDDNFSACTILIIAHRLDAILDCDKVLVLDRGQVIEFDEPNVLLNNENSLFAEMIRNSQVNDTNNDIYDKKKL
ncbi:ATP-binding cassette subfamily C member 4-like [Diabrotica undecimpunctata]|uniref:ATP-binding cassette subfamily C member 4-like n=1 Tax=Diabrotica undecimpunctata TaxID=50387 RepID=UPI003B63E102